VKGVCAYIGLVTVEVAKECFIDRTCKLKNSKSSLVKLKQLKSNAKSTF